MKRFITTLKNIWSIEDLRKRILYTLLLVLIYRIGSYVVLPGVDPSQLGALQSQGSEGLMGLLNMFSGGAFSNASIFALGIMPYITASIVIQLFVMVIPYFQKMQRDGTMKTRLSDKNTLGKVHAKTGSVTGACTLAGYVRTASGHDLAFSIMNGGAIKMAASRKLQDQICAILCDL